MLEIIKEIKEVGITPKDVYLYLKYADGIKNKLKLIKYILEKILIKSGIKFKEEKEIVISLRNLMIKFLPFSAELSPYKDIFIYKKYEKYPFFRLNSPKIIFDIGANIGLYSLKAAKDNKKSKIYSFEPNPFVFKRLKFNIKINNFKNIFIFENAIGSENKFVKFELKESTVCSRISEKDEDLINVKMITIDSFVKEYKIPHIDIMKIDVEGYALEVLKGAIHVLPVTKGIVMEYHPPHENIKEIENFLKNYNFEKVLTFFEYVYFINKNAFSSINS